MRYDCCSVNFSRPLICRRIPISAKNRGKYMVQVPDIARQRAGPRSGNHVERYHRQTERHQYQKQSDSVNAPKISKHVDNLKVRKGIIITRLDP